MKKPFFVNPVLTTMPNNFNIYQREITLRNLDEENKRLREELKKIKKQAVYDQEILKFTDDLEKVFSSLATDSRETLAGDRITKLINSATAHMRMEFVSLCLSKEYLESLFFPDGYDKLLPRLGVSIIDEEPLKILLNKYGKTLFERTSRGSSDIFFPGHGDEVKSQAIIPLNLPNQIIGSLNLGSVHHYNIKMDPKLLERHSARLAIAIENILIHQKLDRDIERASDLQKDLLPSDPLQTDVLNIETYFRPCHKVGGDFFDYFEVGPDRVVMIIADATGHGFSPALLAAMLKFSLQMDNIENLSAKEIVTKINQRFCEILKHSNYITLCYSIIDTKRLTMNLVRAGHPYPIQYRSSSQDTIELQPSGPPVGLVKDASYEDMEVQLCPNDMLVFHTDGLTDTLFENDFHKFVSFIKKKIEEKKDIINEIKALWEGHELEDDLSLLIVKVNPKT